MLSLLYFMIIQATQAETLGLGLLHHRLHKRLHQNEKKPTGASVSQELQKDLSTQQLLFITHCQEVTKTQKMSPLELLELLDELEMEAALTEKTLIFGPAPYKLEAPSTWQRIKYGQRDCKEQILKRAKQF